MRENRRLNRREFLSRGSRAIAGAAAGGALAPTILSSRAGAYGGVRASDRITLALIGCGGMGRANMNDFMGKPGVQVLAVCDPDRARREETRREVEARYASLMREGSYAGCDAYNDYRELLARADIDCVIVGSPDHWHALHVVHAARAGKDIYGEKPLSLTVRQGRHMADAVARYARVFQTGSQQRSEANFRHACELVRNGRLGTLHRVTCGLPAGEVTGIHPPKDPPEGFDYDLWLGPAPDEPYCDHRTHYEFRHILDYSGGKLTDWGAHHIDIAQWAMGTMTSGPTRIEGTGEFPASGLWNAAVRYNVRCRYAGGVEMLITSDAPNGVLFEGERGRLFVTRGQLWAEPTEILLETFASDAARLEVSSDHRMNFLECVRSRREPIAPIEHAHRTISIAHLGNISMQLGRGIDWDPTREEIRNDTTATRMLDRTMRAPWGL